MSVLESLGVVILLLLVLVFGYFFVGATVMFIFGLPMLYVHFLSKFGKRLEVRFPKLYKHKNFQTLIAIFLLVSVPLILLGAILLWGVIYEWLPKR